MYHARLDFSRFFAHFVDVELRFVAQEDNPTLWLPTWIAGSYLIREFSKNITTVHHSIYQNANSDTALSGEPNTHSDNEQTYRTQKINKNTWQLQHIKTGDTVCVRYEVYCFDLSVRTAYVDSERIFGNFTSLVMTIATNNPCQVKLVVPSAFFDRHIDAELVCGLAHKSCELDDAQEFTLETKPMHELYDHPFEIASQHSFAFDVRDEHQCIITHRFFLSGGTVDKDRLCADLQTICQGYADWLGWLPFADYTFMTHATGNDYGGLEHINSTALVTPRTDLPSSRETALPSSSYQRFLGLCSHEYFHAWWVKSVRPDGMMDNDLQSECYTPLLWAFEGFTSYIDNLMLYRTGVIDKASYLSLLADDITRLQNTEGRHHQSVAESSMDAWIKLYRPDENTPNRTVSYYNKGTLVALCLDLWLLKYAKGKRLMDVIKTFVTKAQSAPNHRFGMTTENLGAVLSEMMGAERWQEFYTRYVIGVDDLPIKALLLDVGVTLEMTISEYKPWGLTLEQTPAGLLVKHALPTSPAVSAGISAQDTLIAINGQKANKNHLATIAKTQQDTHMSALCQVFRRDELLTFLVVPDDNTHKDTYTPVYKAVLSSKTDSAWLAI